MQCIITNLNDNGSWPLHTSLPLCLSRGETPIPVVQLGMNLYTVARAPVPRNPAVTPSVYNQDHKLEMPAVFRAHRPLAHTARLYGTRKRIMASKLRYLLVLDFEATCGESGFPRNQMEIIEFPTIVYDLQEKKELGRFHEYVKPVIQPQLTEFCTELTGITQVSPFRASRLQVQGYLSVFHEQETVDGADPFPPVWDRFKAFLKDRNLWESPSTYAFITCGAWDLRTMLPQQLSQIASTNPSAKSDDGLLGTHFQQRVINIKTAFQEKYGYNGKGMANMLRALKMDLVGRHHSGIDDCANILRIAQRMVDDGWVPEVKPELSR